MVENAKEEELVINYDPAWNNPCFLYKELYYKYILLFLKM